MSDDRPEFAFIDWIARHSLPRPEVRLGIGDDAAVLNTSGQDWVLTKDVITSGVHFAPETPPELIGRKALAVNLSDLAAMAARPCAAFIGIVLPKSWSRSQAEQLYQGLFDMARQWNVAIAGGDTNSWDGPLVVSVTLTGLVPENQAVTRTGAVPDDVVLITGPVGGSLHRNRHLQFIPRVKEALQLRSACEIHAMLDISDGLASDLFHLIDANGLGLTLTGAAIPIHADVPESLSTEARLQAALNDGEDFELLLCLDSATADRLLADPLPGIDLFPIGKITREPGIRLNWNGRPTPLPRGGWSHAFGP